MALAERNAAMTDEEITPSPGRKTVQNTNLSPCDLTQKEGCRRKGETGGRFLAAAGGCIFQQIRLIRGGVINAGVRGDQVNHLRPLFNRPQPAPLRSNNAVNTAKQSERSFSLEMLCSFRGGSIRQLDGGEFLQCSDVT
jgi:hypothetical protein